MSQPDGGDRDAAQRAEDRLRREARDWFESLLNPMRTWTDGLPDTTAMEFSAVDAIADHPKIAPLLEHVLRRQQRTDPPGTVVLWEGAELSEKNIKLARTRTAYVEAHGCVKDAIAALERDGHPIGQSTFYDHLKSLDNECPGWRNQILLVSGPSGNPDKLRKARTHGNSRAKPR